MTGDIRQAEADGIARRARRPADRDPGGNVIVVRSDPGFELKLDSLERRSVGIELLSVTTDAGGVMSANVLVPTGQYLTLLNLLDQYRTRQTTGGQPRNKALIDSIASISLATVREFWQDAPALFPAAGQPIWWEAWLRLGNGGPAAAHQAFAADARGQGIRVSDRVVAFPERAVTLIYGTVEQVGTSLAVLFSLAELRRAKELANDYRDLGAVDQRAWTSALLAQLTPASADAPAVCILDSGVNRTHPLLAPALAAGDALTVNDEWGTADDPERHHGTEMAGVALYGDLAEALAGRGPTVLRHRLESVKLFPNLPAENAERDYGPFTIQAVSRAELAAPDRKRVVCMAVTADDRDLGAPSLWSATIDQVCSAQGETAGNQRLFVLAAGNLRDEVVVPAYVYHAWNLAKAGIEDPGQSWNALTVGAYTTMWDIRDRKYAGWSAVAEPGDLCPSSRTSHPWLDEGSRCDWPLKPDVVMEGGNYAASPDGSEQAPIDDLRLLTTRLGPAGAGLFGTIGDTSSATALAARLAARVWARYSELWPETVRGLLVHSARWTDQMLSRFPGDTKAQVRHCLRCYGYGTADEGRALSSAENAATLLYEGDLQPYHMTTAGVRTHEMHLHALPWPTAVLQDLGPTLVTMRVTLSYFVEPSPGRVGWGAGHRYASHGLRFDVIRPEESPDEFLRRVTTDAWDDPKVRPADAGGGQPQPWALGPKTRCFGSVHSDWWTGTAAQLASCGRIAVFPVTGWWRERPHLNAYERRARYSLVVTLETERTDVDIYTAIVNLTTVTTEVSR